MRKIPAGCTAQNTFLLPCPGQELAALYITYQQNGRTVLEKTLADCRFDAPEGQPRAIVDLSQEDTLRFAADNGGIDIQLRLRTLEGTAMKSGRLSASTDELLKPGVI